MSEISEDLKTKSKQELPLVKRKVTKVVSIVAVVAVAVIIITTIVIFLRAKGAPVRIAFQLYESKQGSNYDLNPVIFIHGLCGSRKSWKDIPKIVAEKTRRKVYVIDSRNHGQSDFTEEFSFDLNVDDLFNFMDINYITKAILIGHSMGGITTYKAALRKPERIERIFVEDVHLQRLSQLIIDSVIQYLKITEEAVNSIPKGSNSTKAIKMAIDTMVEKMPILKEQSRNPKEIDYSTFTIFQRNPDGTYSLPFYSSALLDAFKHPEDLMKDPSGQFLGSSHFMYGDRSPFSVASDTENIKKYFPNAEFIEFENCAHQLHSSYTDKFIQTILDRIPT